MKTKNLLLFLFIILFGCKGEEPLEFSYTLGAEKYYYYGEKKVFLYEIIGMSVVQLDTTQNFEVLLNQLKKNSKFTTINTLSENDYLILVTSKLSVKEIKQQPTVINAMPAYNSTKSIEFLNPVYLTGELILHMKKGNTIEDVHHLFEKDAVIKDMEGNNLCILQLRDWNKIFDIANTLHLHEKVYYCEPNKFGYYGLCQLVKIIKREKANDFFPFFVPLWSDYHPTLNY